MIFVPVGGLRKSGQWCFLAVALILGQGATGQAAVIAWNNDTDSSVDVTISGIGAEGTAAAGTSGWGGDITSPSGMWHLTADDEEFYHPEFPLPFVVNHVGRLEFLLPTWADPNYLGGPAESYFNSSTNSGSTFLWAPSGWRGGETLIITSMPVLTDESTWTWTLEYSASGPSLIPEPSMVSLGAVALVMVAERAIRRRSERRTRKPH
jgi:hypothetical protein